MKTLSIALIIFLIALVPLTKHKSEVAQNNEELNEYLLELSRNFAVRISMDDRINEQLIVYCDRASGEVILNPQVWTGKRVTQERRDILAREVSVCWLFSKT